MIQGRTGNNGGVKEGATGMGRRRIWVGQEPVTEFGKEMGSSDDFFALLTFHIHQRIASRNQDIPRAVKSGPSRASRKYRTRLYNGTV